MVEGENEQEEDEARRGTRRKRRRGKGSSREVREEEPRRTEGRRGEVDMCVCGSTAEREEVDARGDAGRGGYGGGPRGRGRGVCENAISGLLST